MHTASCNCAICCRWDATQYCRGYKSQRFERSWFFQFGTRALLVPDSSYPPNHTVPHPTTIQPSATPCAGLSLSHQHTEQNKAKECQRQARPGMRPDAIWLAPDLFNDVTSVLDNKMRNNASQETRVPHVQLHLWHPTPTRKTDQPPRACRQYSWRLTKTSLPSAVIYSYVFSSQLKQIRLEQSCLVRAS